MPEYRYELRRGDEVIATGHLNSEQPFEVGERITIGSRSGDRALDRTVSSRARTTPRCATPARRLLDDLNRNRFLAARSIARTRSESRACGSRRCRRVARVSLIASPRRVSFASGSSPWPLVLSCESAPASA